jgi:hypothetical protein
MVISIEVIGQSITLPDLGGGTWLFGISAVDRFGHGGPWTGFNTTVDATISEPIIDPLPEFSNSTNIYLTWSEPPDESGISYYKVLYWPYGHGALGDRVETRFPGLWIHGLDDGERYHFRVIAHDRVGNAITSETVSTIIDVSPPPAPELRTTGEVKNRDWHKLKWDPVVDDIGGEVEYQVRGVLFDIEDMSYTDIEYPWTNSTDLTVEGMKHMDTYEFYVVARDHLGWESEPSESVVFMVDLTPSEVWFHTPTEGQVITGPVQIHCEMDQGGPNIYWMQYRLGTEEDWEYIVYWTEIVNGPWFFATWDTSGLPDGEYVIRATHIEDGGTHGFAEVNVTLANARLSLSPSDIMLYDSNPDKGGFQPGFMVSVHNNGDVDTGRLTVEVSVAGEPLAILDQFWVEANSHATAYFDLEGPGSHTIVVRVYSDHYDTDEVVKTLRVEEEDVSDQKSSSVAWVGMLAILLAIIAIALNLVGHRASDGEAPKGSEEDLWVESEEGKERGVD